MPDQNIAPRASIALAKDNFNGAVTDPTGMFLFTATVDGRRWNQSYPYQLVIVRKQGKGYTKNLQLGLDLRSDTAEASHRREMVFTLPIPPQELSISTPFAISTQVTLGGIIEEHNAAPLRMITFSGTTGVLPLRGSADKLQTTASTIGSTAEGVFAGTVTAGTKLAVSVQNLVGGAGASNRPNLVPAILDDDSAKATGYYQFRLLQQFLESYVNLKKTEDGRSLRLALCLWKDEAIYLVTPATFEVRRSASSPLEYTYSLSFRAWARRIKLDDFGAEADTFKPVTRDPNRFAQVLNAIDAARTLLQSLRTTLEAVNGDVQNLLFEPLRVTTLFCKDLLGVAHTANDLPDNIKKDMKDAVLAGAADIKGLDQDVKDLAQSTNKNETRAGALSTVTLNSAHPGNTVFEKPHLYHETFSQIMPSKLNLAPAVQKKILEEQERVRKLTRLDFETMRDNLVQFTNDFADSVGAGSIDYNALTGRAVPIQTRTPTDDDFDAIFALNQAAQEMDRLAVSGEITRDQITSMEQMAALARRSGIAFTVPTSKFAVPFPYGSSLEQVAAQYLGDPDRWHELAALNGLRQPYVDEEGFDLALLTNGSGNQVLVADSTNLYPGQTIWVSATAVPRTKRHVTKVEVIGSASVITVDGDPNLSQYTVLGQASVHAFLPDTINSQQLIYIPSAQDPAEDDFKTKSIPGLNEFDPLLRVGGIDLLLTQSMDAAISPDGDWRLSYGLTNVIQKVRIAFETPQGSLLHHPSFGFGIRVGTSTADVTAAQVLEEARSTLGQDPTFTGISSIAILKTGPVLKMTFAVGVAGVSQVIPVSVGIKL